jgi:hypothetical protein
MRPGTFNVPQRPGTITPIGEDVACAGCGYNVRGLMPAAKCPECSFDIETTLLDFAERRHTMGPPLWASDRRWLTDLTEGAALVIVVLVLMLAIRFVPSTMWTLRSRSREVLLGIGCSIFVLAWFAAWKMGRPEPGAQPRRVGWLRTCATFYLLTPFWWGLMPRYNAGLAWIVPALAAMGCGAIAAARYYAIVRELGWRAGSRHLPIHATLLAVLGVIVLLVDLLMPRGHGASNSLSMILGLPTIQLGSAEHVRTTMHILRGGWPNPIEFLVLLFPLWAITVNGWLLALLIRTRRRAAAAAAVTAMV